MRVRNRLIISIVLNLLIMIPIVTGSFSCNGSSAQAGAINTSDQPASPSAETNQPGNNSPVVDEITSEWREVARGETTKIKVIAHDPDGDKLTYSWSCTRGSISGKGNEVTYTAPTGYIDENPITVYVSDGRGGEQMSSINIPVVCCSHAQKNPDWSP